MAPMSGPAQDALRSRILPFSLQDFVLRIIGGSLHHLELRQRGRVQQRMAGVGQSDLLYCCLQHPQASCQLHLTVMHSQRDHDGHNEADVQILRLTVG